MSDWRSRVQSSDPMAKSRAAIQQRNAELGGANPYQTLPTTPMDVGVGNVAPINDTDLNVQQPRSTNPAMAVPPPAPEQPTPQSAPVAPVQQPTNDWRSRVQQDDSFIGRVSRNMDARNQQMQNTADQYVAGKISMPEAMASQGFANAGKLTDTVGEAVSAITPQFVKDIGAGAMNLAGRLPAIGGGTIGEKIPQELSAIGAAHPRLATNARTVMDAAMLVPAASTIDMAARLGSKVVKSAAAQPSLKIPGAVKPTAQDMKKLAGQAYDEAAYLGAKFTPEQVSNKIATEIKVALPKPIGGAVLTTEDKILANNLQEYAALGKKNLSLDDIKRLDESLTQKITDNFIDRTTGQPTANGRKLMQFQQKVRQIVDDVDSPGNDALINGRKLWQAQLQLNELDVIAERASMSLNPVTAMQTGYKNLLMDKDRIRGWPQEAKDLLKKAATPGVTAELLAPLTSRLVAIIAGGSGNIGGAVTANVAGMAGRGFREGLVSRRGAKVQDAIVKDALSKQRPVNIPAPVPEMQKLLAAPGKGAALPMTPEQLAISKAKLANDMKPPAPPIMSGGAIPVKPEAGQVPPKMLPAPGKGSLPPTPPMSDTQVNIAQKLMSRTDKLVETPNVVKTPVSQMTNLSQKLGREKTRDLQNLATMLKSGDMSQNQFVKDVRNNFGLNEQQARSLAKEVKTVTDKVPSKVKVGLDSFRQKLDEFIKDESGSVDMTALNDVLSNLPKAKREQLNKVVEGLVAGTVSGSDFSNFVEKSFRLSPAQSTKLRAAVEGTKATAIANVTEGKGTYKGIVPTELKNQGTYKERVYEGGNNNVPSSHFEVPDYYSHVRYIDQPKDRFVVEIQSDVHGAGRKFVRSEEKQDEWYNTYDRDQDDLWDAISDVEERSNVDFMNGPLQMADAFDAQTAIGDFIQSGRVPSRLELANAMGVYDSLEIADELDSIRSAIEQVIPDYQSTKGVEFTNKDPKWLRNTLDKTIDEAVQDGKKTLLVKIGGDKGLHRAEGVQKWYEDTVEPTLQKMAKERGFSFSPSNENSLGYLQIKLEK